MKNNVKKLIICIALPLLVGGASALITRNSMESFSTLNKPPLSPPGWLFPVVWTILYILMGVASYLVSVAKAPATAKDSALAVYGISLAFNFFWSVIFFNIQTYLLAFFWLLVLWLLIIWAAALFWKIDKTAGILMLPYIIWVTFAGYLNFAIYLLNR